MTARQTILKFFYPVIRKFGSLNKVMGLVKLNSLNQKAKVSFSTLIATKTDGTIVKMSDWKGKKILVVNTASDCGYTGQYAELERLYRKYKNKLVVLAFPTNDFKEQEKGNDASIAQFCSVNYDISFPVFQKVSVVKLSDRHPVFQWLSDINANGWCEQVPVWNFSKYLIDEDGNLLGYFGPSVAPFDKSIVNLI